MDRVYVELGTPFGRPGSVIRYGHFGRPVIIFPSEYGRAWEAEDKGLVAALAPLVDVGRIKLYGVDAFDDQGWSDPWLPLEERARREIAYQDWITGPVCEWIGADSPGATSALVMGASLGAYRALAIALRRADLFPDVLGLSGCYDPTQWRAWGEPGHTAYATNPTWFVPDLRGDHLEWLRARLHVVLTVGQGQWEDTTGAMASTVHMAGLLRDQGVRVDLDMWGHDVAHDWPWWQRQACHHVPRFC